MFNKELFKKICDVTCNYEELEAFEIKLSEQEFDLDNSFEKYYSLNSIMAVVDKYRRKEINSKYLSSWANAYNWIIMASNHNCVDNDQPLTFKEFLIWKISEWLDSLSFYDCVERATKLDSYINAFKKLDVVYGTIGDWDVVMAYRNKDDDDYAVMLAQNDKTQQFIRIYGEVDEDVCTDIKMVEMSAVAQKVKYLRRLGYQEIK
jgi:hypothetical protein